MIRQRRLTTIGLMTCVLASVAAGTPDHDPTKHEAWQSVAGPGTVPGVRALAVEGEAIYALSDKGLICIAPDGAAIVLAGPGKVGDAEALWVTPKTIWLGYGGGRFGGVKCLDRKTGEIRQWKMKPFVPWIERTLFDGKGRIYLYEATTIGVMHVYDAEGKLLWRCRRLGDMPGLMHRPNSLVRRPNGDVYVADGYHNRITIFAPDGQFKGRVQENFCNPHGLAALPGNRVAVLTDYTERIDCPLITILDATNTPEADWVSDQRVLNERQAAWFQYGVSYYQKLDERPKRLPKNESPLTCTAVVGSKLVVGKAGDGSVWEIDVSAFGPEATYPARQRKRLTRKLTTNEATYTIDVGGTLDWTNTTRSQTHSGYCRVPLFRVDDCTTLANTGKVPVVNPHFSVNGKGDFYSVEHFRRQIAKPGMTDLEKAFAAYNFVRTELNGANRATYAVGVQSNYHGAPRFGIPEPTISLVRKWNSFGSVACGSYSGYVARFAHNLGLEARNGGVVAHVVSFVKVDGKEVYLDAIMYPSRRGPIRGSFCPLHDNRGFAGYEELIRDKYLAMRVGEADERGDLPPQLGYYFTDKRRHRLNEYDDLPLWQTQEDTTTMGFTLPPGMTIHYRRAYFGRSCVDPERMQMDATVNGEVVYEPSFADGTHKYGLFDAKNVRVADRAVRPTAGEGRIALKMTSPHPILTGRVEVTYDRAEDDQLQMDLRIPGQGWRWQWTASKVGHATESIGLRTLDLIRDTLETDWQVPPMHYDLRFRMTRAGDKDSVALRRVRVASLFQTMYQCLPRLEAGKNVVRYVDETPGEHELTITHRWKESAFGQEPPPPAKPVFPADGQTLTGYQFTFKWAPAVAPDGATIDDYEWHCSTRPDFLWSTAPNFHLYTRGKTEQPVVEYSLLTHGVKYYWRVRSRTDRGVWGPWGKTWTFQCQGPRVPTDVKLRQEGRKWILSWKPNPEGTRPAKYAVFADNCPSFYPIVDSRPIYEKKIRKAVQKPSNIILETEATEAVVVTDVEEKRDRSHFRVAAIDAAGSRGAPSIFLSATCPFIFSAPVTEARVGKPYRYQARSLWTLGDYDRGGLHTAAPPKGALSFALKKAPRWLKLDRATGVLTGKAPKEGTFDITLTVSASGGKTDTQSFRIAVSR